MEIFAKISENQVTKAIFDDFHKNCQEYLNSEVIIIGAGPSGLVASRELARQGFKVLVIESNNYLGGGFWIGGFLMNTLTFRAPAQDLLDERMREVERRVLPNNHTRATDVARLLDMPFICLHTPADNHVSWFMQKLIAEKKPAKVKDIVSILEEVPEYKEAASRGAGPRVILGNPHRPAGRIFVEMTGGTEGSKEVFDKFYKLGIRTLICMHLSEEHFKKVKDANLNVVIAGHISSDTLGLNLLLDRLEQKAKEKFQVIACSGFRRFRRG